MESKNIENTILKEIDMANYVLEQFMNLKNITKNKLDHFSNDFSMYKKIFCDVVEQFRKEAMIIHPKMIQMYYNYEIESTLSFVKIHTFATNR